ncbi:hypothetical protein ASE14_06335 [Agromyces sp. Root81]|uniref:hypothetical protein n=1 Tax=Agromyces sp. Root81 TaxID=1736601 RepID=UPI0006F1DCF2|nr:hypothetical protein [Agromyces sp. Root81]KRC60606.1 hypothetical protein ASE14_06335 [Agromyces sp. Root81]
MPEALEAWTEFNVAMVGATAALAGLLIVAMSVNIGEIMKSVTLPPRAAASIAALVLAITAGAFGLVPGQPVVAYGVEVLVASVLAGVFQVHAIRVVMREDHVSPFDRVLKSIAGVLPIAAFLVGAVLVVTGVVEVGLITMAVGSVLSIIAALVMAWVVLVEVLR